MRKTTDELEGYAFNVVRGERPVVDPKDGQVVRDRDGQPRIEEATLIVFVDPQTAHTVIVPLSEVARLELIRQLTGGVVVANGGRGP